MSTGPDRRRSRPTALLLAAVLAALGGVAVRAQLPAAGTPWQFDITGFLQEATLDGGGTGALQGGHLKVNGHVVTVPANTIVLLPANALTWKELFTQAPAPYTGTATGMAAADLPAPLTKYEVHVMGNVIAGATPGEGEYVAGLIDISQQGLNSGAGYINFIDYAAGEIRVGGALGDRSTGARVRINDPIPPGGTTGRFSRGLSPDPRFTIDEDNPTIRSVTGFPMCLPRTDPATADDPLCPQGNRPKDVNGAFVGSFTTNAPVAPPGLTPLPDPNLQAPFEIGDYVSFAGTLVADATGIAGPWPGSAGTYISAHTITNNVAIYTFPGTNPAYVAIDVTLVGVGGVTTAGLTEASARTRFEGFSTDPTRIVHLYGVDLNCDGSIGANRDWGTIDVDPGPPTGAVKGRWRFRPPSKVLTMPAAGVFLPATREVRAVIEPTPGTTQVAAWTYPSTATYANGIIAGQYHAPITEYIFPEQVVGGPPPPANFETIPFLASGGYTSSAGSVAAQLDPWPGRPVPTSSCVAPPPVTAPTASAAASPATAGGGALVTLDATSSTGTAPLTFLWAQAATDPVQVVISNAGAAIASFTTPFVPAATPFNFTVTASNSAGSSTASVVVTVTAGASPTVNHVAPLTVTSGAAVSMPIGATTPNTTATLTLSVVQTNTPTVTLAVTPAAPNKSCTATACTFFWTVSFTAPTLPTGQLLPDVLNFTITATDTSVTPNLTSAPEFTSVTVNPIVDTVTITSSEYRIGKQRLILTASSSAVSPNVVLQLQPYLTTSGTRFDPGLQGKFINNGGGLYSLTLVAVPEPAVPPATPLVVKSNLGGASPPTALARIRK